MGTINLQECQPVLSPGVPQLHVGGRTHIEPVSVGCTRVKSRRYCRENRGKTSKARATTSVLIPTPKPSRYKVFPNGRTQQRGKLEFRTHPPPPPQNLLSYLRPNLSINHLHRKAPITPS